LRALEAHNPTLNVLRVTTGVRACLPALEGAVWEVSIRPVRGVDVDLMGEEVLVV